MECQSINIRPERNVFPRTASMQDRHDIRFKKRLKNLKPQSGNTLPDRPGCFPFISRQLRNLMEIMTEFDNSR